MNHYARGSYHYSLDRKAQEVGEPWTLTQVEGGWRLEGQRLVKGKPALNIEADYAGSHCVALKLQWHGSNATQIVHYKIADDTLEWRLGDGSPQEFMLPPGCLMFPLLRAGTGPLLRELVKGPRCVLMPDMRAPRSPQFLKPLLSDRRAEQPAGPGGSRYRYFGGEYGDAGSDWWLGQHGLVTQYTWETPQGTWDVRLDSFASSEGFEFS